MASFAEVIRIYPLLALLVIAVPLIGGAASGLVGAYLGYDNLLDRLAKDKQNAELKKQLGELAVPVEALRRYENALAAQGQNFDILRRIIQQFDQLSGATSALEQFTGSRLPQILLKKFWRTLRQYLAKPTLLLVPADKS
jgi:hypothetical protein